MGNKFYSPVHGRPSSLFYSMLLVRLRPYWSLLAHSSRIYPGFQMKQLGVLPLPPDGQCSELRVERSWAERSGTLTSPGQCVVLLDKTLLSLHWPLGHCISYLSLWLVTTTHPPTHPQPHPLAFCQVYLNPPKWTNTYWWTADVLYYIYYIVYILYIVMPHRRSTTVSVETYVPLLRLNTKRITGLLSFYFQSLVEGLKIKSSKSSSLLIDISECPETEAVANTLWLVTNSKSCPNCK